MIDNKSFKNLSILVLIGILLVFSILLIRPIALSVLAGLILAYVFFPVYKFLLRIFRFKTLTAFIIVAVIIFTLLASLWYLFPLLAKQIIEMYLYIQKFDVYKVLESIFPAFKGYSQNVASSFSGLLSGIASKLLSSMSSTLMNLPNILLQTAVVFFIFFFGLRDGEEFVEYIRSLSPFSESLEQDITKKFKDITNAVIYGHLAIGALQGVLTGIGLYIFGVPQPLLFTIIAMLLAIIPFMGAWLVWIPASAYLFISGNTASAIAFVIYGSVVISWIDNILRPYIVARKTNMSSAIIFIGMIGGMIVFGVLGLVIGPLTLAYLLILLEFYRKRKDKVKSEELSIVPCKI